MKCCVVCICLAIVYAILTPLQVCAEWIPDSSCSLLFTWSFCRRDSVRWWPGSPATSARDECVCCQEGYRRVPVECWAAWTGTKAVAGVQENSFYYVFQEAFQIKYDLFYLLKRRILCKKYCVFDVGSVSWALSSSSRQGRSLRWRQWCTWWWHRVTPDTAWPLLLIWNWRASRGLSQTHHLFAFISTYMNNVDVLKYFCLYCSHFSHWFRLNTSPSFFVECQSLRWSHPQLGIKPTISQCEELQSLDHPACLYYINRGFFCSQ